jgi:hypothetical protein
MKQCGTKNMIPVSFFCLFCTFQKIKISMNSYEKILFFERKKMMMLRYFAAIFSVLFLISPCFGEPAVMTLVGDWAVGVQFRFSTRMSG